MKINKFFKILLEINDVSFKYYLGIYLVLLILDIWKGDFVFRVLRFPLDWLMWFVIASGALKLFFNLDKLILWAKQSHFFGSKVILNLLSFLKGVENYFSYLFQEFKKSVNSIFSWSLIFYLILLLIKEFKDFEFVKEALFFEKSPIKWFLAGRMNWLLGWVILTGIFSVFWGEQQEKLVKEKITKKDYFFVLGLGLLGAYLIFCKTKELGWLSYVISVISGLLIILLSVIIIEEDE
ncbi:hypothetical protein J7K44_00555 [bacterium]|nr:hypothetical protein [bacterium]